MRIEEIFIEEKVNCPKVGRLLSPSSVCFGDSRMCQFYHGRDESKDYIQCSYNYEKSHPPGVTKDDTGQ